MKPHRDRLVATISIAQAPGQGKHDPMDMFDEMQGQNGQIRGPYAKFDAWLSEASGSSSSSTGTGIITAASPTGFELRQRIPIKPRPPSFQTSSNEAFSMRPW